VLFGYDGYEDRRYLAALDTEIARLAPLAARGTSIDKSIEDTRARLALLEEFRTRTHADLNSLLEVTRILPPPAWLQIMQINRGQITLQGEAEQAAALLKLLDASPLFRDSEFLQMSRNANGEVFQIRSAREGGRP
jgi:general secretion pathway protein L